MRKTAGILLGFISAIPFQGLRAAESTFTNLPAPIQMFDCYDRCKIVRSRPLYKFYVSESGTEKPAPYINIDEHEIYFTDSGGAQRYRELVTFQILLSKGYVASISDDFHVDDLCVELSYRGQIRSIKGTTLSQNWVHILSESTPVQTECSIRKKD